MTEKALNLLGLMRKAGKIELGENAVGIAVREGKAKLLLIVPDASENARHRAESFSNGRKVRLVELPFSKFEISQKLGKANTVMAAITDSGFAEAFLKELGEETEDQGNNGAGRKFA